MPEVTPSKYLVTAGWDSVPHLDEKTKKELLDSTPPYLRDARTKGIPSMGAGAIYPIAWEEVTCELFEIPVHWKRGYGLDIGWNRTAAVWVAQDPIDGMLYANAEYYADKAQPLIHAEAIKSRGAWMTGAIDPASRGRTQDEGKRLIDQYEAYGLNVVPAINAVLPGLDHIWSLLSLGRLKFFRHLSNTADEYRFYRREIKEDKLGVSRAIVVKSNDHLMDALRYAIMTWDRIAKVKPAGERVGQSHRVADSKAGY